MIGKMDLHCVQITAGTGYAIDLRRIINRIHQNNIPFKEIPQLSQSLIETLIKLVDKPIIDINLQNYIKEKLEKVKMEQHYNIRNLQTKKKLDQHCNSMIPVRGDGNSFYTAFGYQFVKFLINNSNYLEEVKQNYSNIKMGMIKDGESLISDPQTEENLRKNFFDRINYFSSIRNAKERNKKFEEHFAAFEKNEEDLIDGFFQTLTVVFMRNLSNLLIEKSEIRDLLFDKENLLIWEKECINYEPIISLLAKHLKLQVKVLMFDNSNFILLEYEPENQKNTIILLMKPGLYNIGIKN